MVKRWQMERVNYVKEKALDFSSLLLELAGKKNKQFCFSIGKQVHFPNQNKVQNEKPSK